MCHKSNDLAMKYHIATTGYQGHANQIRQSRRHPSHRSEPHLSELHDRSREDEAGDPRDMTRP